MGGEGMGGRREGGEGKGGRREGRQKGREGNGGGDLLQGLRGGIDAPVHGLDRLTIKCRHFKKIRFLARFTSGTLPVGR